ncbi:anthranilate synthase alpha subunit 1, chloroplastic-like, partial [Olea europaea subsp. europaea]
MQASTVSHRPSPVNNRLSLLTGISSRRRSSSFVLFGFRTFQCCSVQSPSSVLDEKRFIEASKNGNLIPLCEIIFSDQLTPVLAYRCLVKEDDLGAPSFLFESVKPGYRTTTVGRYSIVGAQPTMEIVAKENKVTVLDHEGGTTFEKFVEDPMMVPRSISEDWRPQLIEELPDAFC